MTNEKIHFLSTLCLIGAFMYLFLFLFGLYLDYRKYQSKKSMLDIEKRHPKATQRDRDEENYG